MPSRYTLRTCAPKETDDVPALHRVLRAQAYAAFATYNATAIAERRGRTTPPTALHGRQRGLIVNYAALPGAVAALMLPAWGVRPSVRWRQRMDEVSQQYSKARGGTEEGAKGATTKKASHVPFRNDTADKEANAPPALRQVRRTSATHRRGPHLALTCPPCSLRRSSWAARTRHSRSCSQRAAAAGSESSSARCDGGKAGAVRG